MSLEQKWKEYITKTPVSDWLVETVREAFYAGAEAVLPVAAYNADLAVEYQAEIDQFRSQS